MTRILTAVEVAQGLVNEGFTGWSVVTMGAICVPESWNKELKRGRDAHAINLNDHDPSSRSYLSIDAGLFQINDHWSIKLLTEFEIIDPNWSYTQQLLHPPVNFRAARAIFVEAGGARDPRLGYNRWNAYVRGLHVPYLTEARAAARSIGVQHV